MRWKRYGTTSNSVLKVKAGLTGANFWYLFAAYMVFWTAMFAYVMSLSRKNRELQQDLRELQARVEHMLVKKDTA